MESVQDNFGSPNGPAIHTVSQFTGMIRKKLTGDDRFRGVWVRGEVSDPRPSQRGHLYFTLKDQGATLPCVMFSHASNRSSRHVADGAGLMIHGSLDLYEPRGQYNFKVDAVLPSGTGDLYAEFVRRKTELEREGLFRPEIKRPLPRYPVRVGVVSSPAGAAFRDIVRVFGRRYPVCELVLSPAVVQGEACPQSVVMAMERLRDVGPLDAVILARGGGSFEDLFGFSNEDVVRAIRTSPWPVITGIGHETDTTLADLAADVRAATPTAAAEILAPDTKTISRDMWQLVDRASRSLAHSVETRQLMLDRCTESLWASMDRSLQIRRDSVERLSGMLNALSPLSVMDRGYAVASSADGRLIKTVEKIGAGDRISVRLSDGSLDTEVLKINKHQNLGKDDK